MLDGECRGVSSGEAEVELDMDDGKESRVATRCRRLPRGRAVVLMLGQEKEVVGP